MSVHSKFIQTPISNILNDAAQATNCIASGINVYPLCDYILQSVFMKMTGSQEQKMKCICWELATVNFDIRRELYSNWTLGECSRIEDKESVLKFMLKALCDIDEMFDIHSFIDRQSILDETKFELESFYQKANLKGFAEKSFNEYKKIIDQIADKCIYSTVQKTKFLFAKCDNCGRANKNNYPLTCSTKKGLRFMYDKLYLHRNRCAHNLTSYQQNLPALNTLRNTEYLYENYFIRFALLIIIDKVMIKLYRTFEDVCK